MKRLLAILVVWMPAALAAENTVTKVIPVQHADPRELAKVLKVFGCCFDANYALKALTVSVPERLLPGVEDVIRRFDVGPAPVRNVEITAWFLLGGEQESTEGLALPQELEPVAKQIRAALSLRSFRLLDTSLVRTASGGTADAFGALEDATAPRKTEFRFASATVSEDGKSVRLNGLHIGLRLPIPAKEGWSYTDTGIGTGEITVTEGQKVVVGKYSMAGPKKSLIVVLSAKIL